MDCSESVAAGTEVMVMAGTTNWVGAEPDDATAIVEGEGVDKPAAVI
jgi:hypothetical protein